jgi:hypothetical protein
MFKSHERIECDAAVWKRLLPDVSLASETMATAAAAAVAEVEVTLAGRRRIVRRRTGSAKEGICRKRTKVTGPDAGSRTSDGGLCQRLLCTLILSVLILLGTISLAESQFAASARAPRRYNRREYNLGQQNITCE